VISFLNGSFSLESFEPIEDEVETELELFGVAVANRGRELDNDLPR
jgi:hypothetical protein